MTYGSYCLICGKSGTDKYLHQLGNIKRFLDRKRIKDIPEDAGKYIKESGLIYGFTDVDNKCQFGLRCHKSDIDRPRIKKLAEEIKPLIVAYIMAESDKEHGSVRELLRLLGGYYPREYRMVEQLFYKLKKQQ